MTIKIVKTVRKGLQISARPKVPRASTPFKHITRELGPENLAKAEKMLLEGDTCEKVAKTIKGEWGLLDSYKMSSVVSILSRYRKDVLAPRLTYIESNPGKVSKFAEKVDVLENLTKLVEIQQARVTKGLLLEETHITLSTVMKFEIQTLAMLYRQLSDLLFDMGLVRKAPIKYQVEAAATRTQQLLETAMKKSERVDQALTQAYKVLDGVFTSKTEPPNAKDSGKHR